MSYTLQAFIGKTENVKLLVDKFHTLKIVGLKQGYSLVPITDKFTTAIGRKVSSPTILDFKLLTEYIESLILDLIEEHEIGYVESEFWAGAGGHLGIIWKHGKRNFIGKLDIETLNNVLNQLGVKKENYQDEFQTLELGRFRSTDGWIRSIT